jgi:DNA-binding phage protein
MPKLDDFDESHMAETCKVILAQKKPNIIKIAREFGASRTPLTDSVKNARSPTTPTKLLENCP